MMKKNKAFISLLATMGIAVAAGAFALNVDTLPISAENTNKLAFESGASIRLSNPTGIRYTATLDSTLLDTTGDKLAFAEGVTVGMLIVPNTVVSELTDDYVATLMSAYGKQESDFTTTFSAEQIQSKTVGNATTYYVCGAITGITDEYYNSEYRAVAYYVEDGEYHYSEKSDARKISYVADKALSDGLTVNDTPLTDENKETLGDILEKSVELSNGGSISVSGYAGETVDLSAYFTAITGTLTYTVTDDTYAAVDGGVLTYLEAGETTVTVTAYDGKVSIPVSVTVNETTKLTSANVSDNEVVTSISGEGLTAKVGSTASSFTLDMSDKKDEITGTLQSVTVGGTKYTNVSYTDGIVTVTGNVGKSTYGEKSYTAYFESETNRTEVSGKTLFITLKISNQTELKAYTAIGHDVAGCASHSNFNCKVRGYFTLDADITCTEKLTLGAVQPTSGWFATLFSGTIDGRGHTIDNYRKSDSYWSFVYKLDNSATIKNISFTNLDNTESAQDGFLFQQNWGWSLNVENVYLHYSNYVNRGACLLSADGDTSEDTYKNIVVTAHNVSGETTNKLINGTTAKSIQNVYAYGLDATGVTAAYADKAAMIAAGNDYSAFTATDFWALDSDGLPYPKEQETMYAVKFVVDGTTVSDKVLFAGNTFTVPTSPEKTGFAFAGWALAGETTAYDFEATDATVVTSDMTFTTLWEASVESAKVSETEVVTAIANAGTGATVATQASSYTIDVSDVNPAGELVALTVGATTYALGEFSYADGKITVNKAPLLAAYGLQNYKAKFVGDGATTVVTGKTLFITMAISNYDELKSFEAIGKLAYDNDESTTNYIGYYTLDANVNCKVGDAVSSYNATGKFQGTFDGCGYTISNLEMGSYGLFGTILDGTVIKNFALTNTKNNGTWGTALLGRDSGENATVTFENIYIQMSYVITCWNENSWNALIMGQYSWSTGSAKATYKNVVVNIGAISEWGGLTGVINAPANSGNIQNVYVCGYTAGAVNMKESGETNRGLDGDSADKDKYGEYSAISGLNADIAAGKIAAKDFTDTGYWTYDETNGLAFVVKA